MDHLHKTAFTRWKITSMIFVVLLLCLSNGQTQSTIRTTTTSVFSAPSTTAAEDNVNDLEDQNITASTANPFADQVFVWTHHEEEYPTNGRRLENHVFLTITDKRTSTQCALECLRHSKCLSFNYAPSKDECQLNDASHVQFPGLLVVDIDQEYHTKTAYSIAKEALGPCFGDPCSSRGRCLETKSVMGDLIALCLCEEGWTGTLCNLRESAPQWSLWQEWGACSVSCHRGWRVRQRSCEDLDTDTTLNPVECYGADQEYGVCEEIECPRWEAWGAWGDCSADTSCGQGVKVRTRTCGNGGTVGVDRYCLGLTNESTPCDGPPCFGPIRLTGSSVPGEGVVELFDTKNNQWSLMCSALMTTHIGDMVCKQIGWPGLHSVVQGSNFSHRADRFGLTEINCLGQEKNILSCPHNALTPGGGVCADGLAVSAAVQCNVNGVWSLWSEWSNCDVTCENGTRTRNRTCDHPPALHAGKTCQGETEQYKPCTLPWCPIDGVWTPWTDWTFCSLTCGGGTQGRTRVCEGTKYGGKFCQGNATEDRTCNELACPIDGYWLPWAAWSKCSLSCGNGTMVRNRICEQPKHSGQSCNGSATEEADCNTHHCPVDGKWNPWSDWAECSVSCAWGIQWRNRTCDGPYNNGTDCSGNSTDSQECHPGNCPVDGHWMDWESWQACSTSCDGGVRNRIRECYRAQHGGKDCDGSDSDTSTCNEHPCPVDGKWLEWSDWGQCSTTCGNGTQWRSRKCDGPFYDGANCTGPADDDQACNTNPCPIDGVWEAWSQWWPCSVSCGGGEQSRQRNCTGPFYDGKPCPGNWTEIQDCNEHHCPVDGYLTDWSVWDSCDISCGGGIKHRTRTCVGPFYDGKPCNESLVDNTTCNTHHCPIDGKFLSWGDWSECSVSCGGGLTYRNRTCDGPYYNGTDCIGPWEEVADCKTQPCPVDGAWLPWSDWGTCSVSCDGGTQSRDRMCNGTQHGGKLCQGDYNQTRDCNTHPCPEDGYFSVWSNWTTCTLSCGSGSQERSRDCIGPFHNGLPCVGDFNQTQSCNDHHCPIDGFYYPWAAWEACSVSCGGGEQNRYRQCEPPKYLGKDCEGPTNQTQACKTQPCPVDGVYGDWSDWSLCTTTCGGGTQWKNRTCTPPKHGGDDCVGPENVTQECNTNPCPIDGVWQLWGEWSACNRTCGGGLRTRIRICTPPQHEGMDCEGSKYDYLSCNENPCPIPGDWFPWTEWTACTVTCGGGRRHRSRLCDDDSYGNLTAPCEGDAEEDEDCHTFNCRPLARTCTEWGERGLTADTHADIDPDGPGDATFDPEVVYCDMTSNGGIGVTVIGHDQEKRVQVQGWEGAREYEVELTYNITFEQVTSVVDQSAHCEQYISWECFAALIHNYNDNNKLTTGWLNRTRGIADYFGGASPGSHSCACGMNNTCFSPEEVCNCDSNDPTWRQDDGYLTYKDDLPVYAFVAGDTAGDMEEGYHHIGEIRCWGKQRRSV